MHGIESCNHQPHCIVFNFFLHKMFKIAFDDTTSSLIALAVALHEYVESSSLNSKSETDT